MSRTGQARLACFLFGHPLTDEQRTIYSGEDYRAEYCPRCGKRLWVGLHSIRVQEW